MSLINNFEFNGVKKDYVKAVESLDIDYGPNRSVELIRIPGALGAEKGEIEDGEKQITLQIVIKAPPGTSLEEVADDMVEWLYTDNAETRTLRLSRKEDKYYNVFVSSPISRDEIVNFARCTIDFVCPEGRGYSVKSKTNTFTQNFVSVVNNGTVETPFKLTATALKDAPYLFLGDETKNFETHIMFGDDNEDKPLKNYSPNLLIDEFRPGSLNTYSRMATTESIKDRYLANGPTGAKFGQTEEAWYLDLPSVTQTSGWRGGAYKRTYNRAVQDFRVTYKVRISQNQMGSGKIGHFIYDTAGRLMLSMGYQNVYSTRDSGRILFMAYDEQGNEKMLYGPEIPARYKRIKALVIYMRMIRTGNKFELSYWFFDDHDPDGRTDTTRLKGNSTVFTDTGNFYQRKIGASAFGIFRGSGNHRYMSHLGVYMYELLEKPLDARDYIIKQGDIIEIDTGKSDITVNGVPITDTTLSSDYFEVGKGLTTLALMPSDTFDAKVTWQDAYY